MSRMFIAIGLTALCVALLDPGCQRDVTTPGTAKPQDSTQQQSASAQSHHCLGAYLLAVDTETPEIDVVPLRTAEWHFNMTGVLNATMGVTPLLVPGQSDPAHGLIVIDITLTHPFSTKPQFSGFDIKGVLITPGSLALGPLIFADADETRLENADGFTRWWNPTEFTSPGILGYTQGVLAKSSASALTATPSAPAFTGSELFPVLGSDYYYCIDVDAQFGYMAGYFARPHLCLLWPPGSPTLVGPVYEGFANSARALIAHRGTCMRPLIPPACTFSTCIDPLGGARVSGSIFRLAALHRPVALDTMRSMG